MPIPITGDNQNPHFAHLVNGGALHKHTEFDDTRTDTLPCGLHPSHPPAYAYLPYYAHLCRINNYTCNHPARLYTHAGPQ